MGRESTVTKKRVIDTVKTAIERANECIRDTAAVQQTHNEFVRIVEGKITEVKDIAHRASVWSEANEGQLANARKHIEGQITTVAQDIDRLKNVATFDRGWISNLEKRMPPDGFIARLKWLFFGPSDEPANADRVNWSPQ